MKMRKLMTLVLAICATGAVAARAAEDSQAFEKIERGR
jgi:Skp family chaperone for outer membrane proteins